MTDSARPRAAVIGAGPMGLAVAYELAKLGHRVTIFERDNRIGGMSAHIDFDGTASSATTTSFVLPTKLRSST